MGGAWRAKDRERGLEAELRRLDPEALGDHIDRLFRAAWAMTGSREDAEDLVQETYTRVLAKPRFLRGGDDLGYLLRVLRNTHISRLRAAGRRPSGVPFAEEAPEPIDERATWRPEAGLDVVALFEVIAGLPEVFRDVLVAIDVAGLSYSEASRALKVPEATVTSRLFRARRQAAAGMESRAPGVMGRERT